MKNKLLNAVTLSFACLMFLAGCSSAPTATGGAANPDGHKDPPRVDTDPMSCVVIKDDHSGVASLSVSCSVTISDADVTSVALSKSVQDILRANSVPAICVQYTRTQALDTKGTFMKNLEDRFVDDLGSSKPGWTVQDFSCVITDA